MLPSVLSETVCSLRARVDRLTLSVVFVLDPEYRVRPELTWRGRSVIRSLYSLTYEQADRILAGKTDQARCARGILSLCVSPGLPADPRGEEKPWLWDSPDGGITGASVKAADEPKLRAALEVISCFGSHQGERSDVMRARSNSCDSSSRTVLARKGSNGTVQAA